MKWIYKRSWRSSIYHFCNFHNKSKVAKEVLFKIEPILHRPLLCASNHCECTIPKTHKSWQNIINNKPCWRICNQHKPEQQETISPIQIVNQKDEYNQSDRWFDQFDPHCMTPISQMRKRWLQPLTSQFRHKELPALSTSQPSPPGETYYAPNPDKVRLIMHQSPPAKDSWQWFIMTM